MLSNDCDGSFVAADVGLLDLMGMAANGLSRIIGSRGGNTGDMSKDSSGRGSFGGTGAGTLDTDNDDAEAASGGSFDTVACGRVGDGVAALFLAAEDRFDALFLVDVAIVCFGFGVSIFSIKDGFFT